jgi:DNA repair protein RadA/Sms
MAKRRTVLACGACGHHVAQWVGRCPGCGEFGTIEEGAARAASGGHVQVETLAGGAAEDVRRLASGFPGVDRVLGGGMVPGSVVLVAGEPGIGKSTLLLQVAGTVAAAGGTVLVASGEETRGQVGARARRLGVAADEIRFVPGRELDGVVEAIRAERPVLAIVDSIQAVRDPSLSSLPGGPAQVRVCADALIGVAKATGAVVLVAGQVTKEGEVAGPRTLEHAVDVVCAFDPADAAAHRVFTGGKNRFGPEGEVSWFEMTGAGLVEVDGTALLGGEDREIGAATALVAAGRRGIAVQVQALVGLQEGPPRRHVSGLDPRRFGLVAAVVERSSGLRLGRVELYGAAAGGVRVEDAGADLAVAAALASAASSTAPPARTAFCGELSLTGAVRPVAGLGPRLAAAAAAGIEVVFAAGSAESPPGVRLVPVRRLRDALGWVGGVDRAARSRGVPDAAVA